MATKLKNLRLTSVDMVRNGANQEADICLFKSADPEEAPEQLPERETNILKRFINWLLENPEESEEEPVEKDYTSFANITAARENNEKLWQYTSALTESIRSIQDDNELDKDQKLQMMKQSLCEFNEAFESLLEALCNVPPRKDTLMAKSDEEDLSYLFDLEKSDPEDEEDDWDDEEEIDDEIEDVEKFNPNHDESGRFASGGGGGYKAKTVNHNGFEISNDHPNGGYTASKDGKKLVTREEYYDAKSGTYKPTGKEHLMQFTSVAGAKKMIDYLERSGDLADHLAKSTDIDEIEEV